MSRQPAFAPMRRQLLLAGAAFAVGGLPGFALAQQPEMQARHAARLKRLLAAGELPYIDIESSCNAGKVDIGSIARDMDRCHIGLMALSSDIGKDAAARGVRFDDFSTQLLARYPEHFLPVGNGAQPPLLTEHSESFLAAQEEAAQKKKFLLFGEYEFRHYPSPRQVKRGESDRDIHVPLDGPTGHAAFAMAERTGLPLQIHYEFEDELMPALEALLAKYPKAVVIWCHLAQVRYLERASRFSPRYIETLLQQFPNLYFDTAMGDASSIYAPSGQRHARVWADDGTLRPEWRDLIVAYPNRFLSALDLGQDRLDRLAEYDRKHRFFLEQLPPATRQEVAYRNAWRLLYGSEFA